MRSLLSLLTLLLAVAVPAMAQPVLMDAEDLSPAAGVSETAQPRATTTSPSAPAAVRQPLVAADIIVSNVTVVISNSTGLERDAALAIAARQGMPAALAQLDPPVTGEKATTFIKAQGDLQRYVKNVHIVKELLVPHYTLTADLTFDGGKLARNLGTRVPAKTATTSSTTLANTLEDAAAPDTRPLQAHEVQLVTHAPAEQDRLLKFLNTLPETQARYLSITTVNATYAVRTPLPLDELEQALTKQGLSTVPGPAQGLRVSY